MCVTFLREMFAYSLYNCSVIGIIVETSRGSKYNRLTNWRFSSRRAKGSSGMPSSFQNNVPPFTSNWYRKKLAHAGMGCCREIARIAACIGSSPGFMKRRCFRFLDSGVLGRNSFRFRGCCWMKRSRRPCALSDWAWSSGKSTPSSSRSIRDGIRRRRIFFG